MNTDVISPITIESFKRVLKTRLEHYSYQQSTQNELYIQSKLPTHLTLQNHDTPSSCYPIRLSSVLFYQSSVYAVVYPSVLRMVELNGDQRTSSFGVIYDFANLGS